MYGGEVGPAPPVGGFGQPLTVDTGCSSPSGIRHANPMAQPAPNQHGALYSQGQGPMPPQYHPHNLPVSCISSP